MGVGRVADKETWLVTMKHTNQLTYASGDNVITGARHFMLRAIMR
jgi:hypothetical protein